MTIAVGSEGSSLEGETTDALVERLPGVATAAVFSMGAGLVHAGAIGIHAEHVTLARLFIIVSVFQLAFGMATLLRPTRWLAAITAVGNLLAVAAWLTTRLTGISWIEGLETREAAQFADTACAILGLVAGGLALTAALVGWHRAPDLGVTRGSTFPAMVVAAIAVPALFSGATHVHNHTVSTASGATVIDESLPHVHNADGTVTVTDESAPHDHGSGGAAVAATADTTDGAATATTVHTHAPAAVPTVPYDPTKPIDLSGVAGVTPEEQARAENLVAITVVRLPQWSDPAVAEAAGFHSIGDAITGFEHYINWDWINDNDVLDPDHPESLVYIPQPDGTKRLVSAMFMLPDTTSLAEVPDVGGALTQWHIHDNLCFTKDPVAPRVAGITDANGGCPASLQKFPAAPMIHVWITPNVCGPFAALEGVGAGQILPGQQRLCDHVHGASGTLGG
jgi:hypothetical protein